MDADGQSGVFSTVHGINELQDSWPAGVPFITMQQQTNHKDRRMTSLSLNIEIPGVAPSSVRNLQVFAAFEYLLSEKLQIEMQGLMHINLDTPNGMAKAIV